MDFGGVTNLVNQIGFIEAIPALRGHDFPYGLHNSLCTLHLFCSPEKKIGSATGATLDTGGELNLT